MEMKILHLTLKKQWFDMIASGKKREEYREIKPYWSKRLVNQKEQYTHIMFRNGYSKDAPRVLVEYNKLLSGLGIVEWGAPEGKAVYILRLGNVIQH